MSWQPIETAPKDGTEVLAVGNNYGDPAKGLHYAVAAFKDGEWRESSCEDGGLRYLTNWMELPHFTQDSLGKADLTQPSALLTDAELSDPEYMRAYVDELQGTIADLLSAQRYTASSEDIDFSLKSGDIVTNGKWELTDLIVEDVNWALRAIALRLGNDGGIVIWPVNGLRRVTNG